MANKGGREEEEEEFGEEEEKSPWVCVASDTAKLCADLPGGAQAEALKLRALITPTDTRTI